MLTIISPAKSQDFTSPIVDLPSTQPIFTEQTQHILQICKNLSKDHIKKLMSISDKLTDLNYDRFQDFNNHSVKQAIFAYDGDVYNNIDRKNFTKQQLSFLQDHLLIISGLYGVLKPLDLIRPYRLEMAVKLPNIMKLAEFWQNNITSYINKILATKQNQYLINLASNEYSSSIDLDELKYPIINIHFKEYKNNKLQIIGINAKKARGSMVNFISKHLVDTPEKLKEFSELDYKYSKNDYTDKDWVFVK
ncbi:MAG: peroxide stress protein YaaA [Rickettsia endosymbiont of Bryobia graminum]|nr:peroxide stress protein YaaA [Rickettsia endosymbiont of Bryobia graminum]